MSPKRLTFILFVLLAIVQCFIPARMIFAREEVLHSGVEYKFRTAPLDPHDPFRGKYIHLRFIDNTVQVAHSSDWPSGESIYAVIGEDSLGYAFIQSVTKEAPEEGENYLEARVNIIYSDGSRRLSIDYPFDRFYMDEFKAYQAELSYQESLADSTLSTFALVNIKNG